MAVLVWGVPTESPVAMVTRALQSLGAEVILVAPQASDVQLDLGVGCDGRPDGWIRCGRMQFDWNEIDGTYARPVEPELAPEFRAVAQHGGDAGLAHAQRVHQALLAFTELTPGRVTNRLSAMTSNMSKPFQAQVVARHGFSIPDTLITDSAAEAVDFAARHGEVIYKSTSGVRSVVNTFDPVRDAERLRRLHWCPVQFQERVTGPDVRVHVVGREVYPAIVDSTAIDYRYARRQVGTDASLRRYELPAPWADRCVELAADLGLPFAGIDLKLAPEGRVVCFEVNPSPGFPWYENEAGLPISDAVARYLLGG